DLVKTSKNVFIDLSNSDLANERQYIAMLKEALRDTTVARRVLYGSDWFMNTLSQDATSYLANLAGTLVDALGDDEVKQIVSANPQEFLLGPVGSCSRARLAAFYGDHEKPSWLTGFDGCSEAAS